MSRSSQLEVGSAERVTVAGGLAALRTGDPEATPVLLVPGFTGSKEDFGPLLDPLAAAGFQVTAIDLPGQFESPGPDHPAAYAPDLLAHAVRAVVAELGGPVHLLGHSFGGLVTRAAVIAEPEPFASLVLMGSGPARIGPERAALLELLAPVLADGGVEAVYDASVAVDAAEPGFLAPPAALADFLRRRFLAGSAAMLTGMADALLAEPDRVAELGAAGVPTLVLHGAHDVPWPVAWQRDMATRLGADYLVIPDAEHSPAVENPSATVEALVGFWRG